jgi:phenylalanyl-tRNA synthetase alpha chain
VKPVNPREVAEQLHENERRILLVLKKNESASTSLLAEVIGLSKDAVEKACSWAETKGVLTFNEETTVKHSLTDEGQRYANGGLPEKNLLRLIAEGVNEINGLKEDFPALNIALVWIRRNEWATIEKGRLNPTQKGEKALETQSEDEQLLDQIGRADISDVKLDDSQANRLQLLIRRNLVEATETVSRWVEITDFGRQVSPLLDIAQQISVITQLTPEMLQSGSWRNARFQRYDIHLPAPNVQPGKRHFISSVIDYIRRFWVELGFKEMTGEYLELGFWNFDALYQPQDHPSRELADTFYMKTPFKGHLPNQEMVKRVKETHENGWTTGSTGWQYKWDPEVAMRNCLRTHTTSLSVAAIAKLTEEELPAKFFSVGRVFRNETIDWNHLAEFYQTDGIVVGEGVTFRDLQGYLKAYLEGMGMERFRFRPGYFPYTEMSMEAEVWIEEKGAWMELFGAGIFRPEVVKPLLGKDVPVLAWGPGFGRLIMLQYGIESIRELYGNDIGLLRQAKLWME